MLNGLKSSVGTPGRLKGRVLFVDDAPMTRLLTGRLLSNLGLGVTTADNGRDAVDVAWMACNKHYDFDLVLMDVEMPVMGGLEATRLLRHLGYDKPIIAITGSMDPDIEQQCKAAGFNHFLAKPVKNEDLQDLMRNCLQKKEDISESCAA